MLLKLRANDELGIEENEIEKQKGEQQKKKIQSIQL